MKKNILFIVMFITLAGWGSALLAQPQTPARYEIDMKRKEVRPGERDAILRAREFIRLDPTYYVGYLIEGIYKYEHSSDYLGYKSAITPLKKAFELFGKDYGNVLKARYTEQNQYAVVENRFWDYYYITNYLMDSYSNIERPDSVIWLLNTYNSWNMQYDIMGADNYIAWTYHRNRYYTSDKFSFLHNSVEENEKTALSYLHLCMRKIDKNSTLNEEALSYSMVLRTRLSVYHYLALVYDYQQKVDSARYCYEQMMPYNVFPYNNYAIFCVTNGEFEEAYRNFNIALRYDHKDKMLQESIYYLSILNAMRALPQNSIEPLKGFIEDNKVRPGWGWYNIGLARSYLYNGQLDESAKCIKKASSFKEIHIGTTLGNSQYNFSYTLLDLINCERQAATIKFEDKNYWLSPSKLKRLGELKLQQSAIRLALFNQLSANPERDELYYKLFSSENTVSFDEVYSMVKDYGRSFFIKKFEKEAERDDQRPNIRKYFSLLQAKLYLERGQESKAKKLLSELEKTQTTENGFENLFLARMYEALALCEGSGKDFESYRYKFYTSFPQLVPYSNMEMEFYLDVQKGDNNTANNVLDELKSCNIDWTKNKDKEVPKVIIRFAKNGDKNMVTYKVESAWGKMIVPIQTFEYDKPEGVGKRIAYGIFKAGLQQTEVDEDYY